MALSPMFPGSIRTACMQIANGDSTSYKQLIGAGTAGTRVDTACATNSDAANASVVQLSIRRGSVDHILGEVTVPAGAGTNGATPAVHLFSETAMPALVPLLGVLYLEPGSELRARVKSAVLGGNTLSLIAIGGDY